MSTYPVFEPGRAAPVLSPQECWLLGLIFPTELVEARLRALNASAPVRAQVRRAMQTIHGHGRLHAAEGDVDAARTPPASAVAKPAMEDDAIGKAIEDDIIGTAAAAQILGVTDTRVRQLVRSGKLAKAPGSTDTQHFVYRSDLLQRLQKRVA